MCAIFFIWLQLEYVEIDTKWRLMIVKQNVAIRRVREKQVLRLCNFDKNVFFSVVFLRIREVCFQIGLQKEDYHVLMLQGKVTLIIYGLEKIS